MKIFIIIITLFSIQCYGYLGEVKSLPKSKIQINAAEVQSNYTVTSYEKNDVRITEYSNSSGKVFAVTWTGRSHPDLSELLGSYWPEYKDQPRKSQRRKPNAVINSNSLVVEKGGRMREVHGKAYDLNLLPEGFDANAL